MTTRSTALVLLLLGTATFALAVKVDPWSTEQRANRSGSLLTMLLGDGRRLFANHFFAKADAYFHRGVYPGIFDTPHREEMHMVTAGHDDHDHTEPGEHSEEPESAEPEPSDESSDWIAWMNGQRLPTGHAHLGGGDERELLPWLRLATELDPTNPQNYVLTAYWLRSRLQRSDQAEQFLREGLRSNPGNPDILYSLGVIQQEDRSAPDRAYGLLKAAWKEWKATEPDREKPNYLLGEAIVGRMARLDEQAGRLPEAIVHLEELRDLSPHPEEIEEQIRELREQQQNPGPTAVEPRLTAPGPLSP